MNGIPLLWQTKLIEYIRDHPEVIPNDVTLFILRNLNPDGEARAHNVDGRVNENGVDLNRNWPYNWKADWDKKRLLDMASGNSRRLRQHPKPENTSSLEIHSRP